jgi:glycosyltransferase involved in cell wall biosynthesis
VNYHSTIAVVLSSNPTFGGGFQYSFSILDAALSLRELGHQVYPIVLHESWLKHIPENVPVRVVPDTKVGKAARYGLMKLRRVETWQLVGRYIHPLYRFLAQLQPSLVIYPCEYHLMLGIKLPSVVPVHDLMHRYERSFPEVGTEATFQRREFLLRTVLGKAIGVLVDSELGKRHVMESYGVNGERIHVLPFVAPPYVFEEHQPGLDVRAKYQLPERFIFYPAQLWKHKNHLGLIKAIDLLRSRGFTVNAVFCGARKNAAEEIFGEIQRRQLQNQIFYLGYVEQQEIVQLYRRAVALVMPTFFGPTNIPPLEAFALGCPVAVSRVYAMPDQVGDAALLFDPSNEEEMADVVARLWTDEELRSSLIHRGLKRAREWNRDSFNDRFQKIISSILAQRRA